MGRDYLVVVMGSSWLLQNISTWLLRSLYHAKIKIVLPGLYGTALRDGVTVGGGITPPISILIRGGHYACCTD